MDFPYGWYYLTWNIGNNCFAYGFDGNQKLWIPELKETTFESLKERGILLWEEVVFAEKSAKWRETYCWLQNFLYFQFNTVPIYIFDNHNHAFSFWRREFLEWRVEKGLPLIHIDQHSDMNDNEFYLENESWETICKFTNESCNVGNFIKPALSCWILSDVRQIRTEYSLLNYNIPDEKYILDIDLDFWDVSMGIEDFEGIMKKTRELILNSCLVTIAISPYFLDQKRALVLLDSIFNFSL